MTHAKSLTQTKCSGNAPPPCGEHLPFCGPEHCPFPQEQPHPTVWFPQGHLFLSDTTLRLLLIGRGAGPDWSKANQSPFLGFFWLEPLALVRGSRLRCQEFGGLAPPWGWEHLWGKNGGGSAGRGSCCTGPKVPVSLSSLHCLCCPALPRGLAVPQGSLCPHSPSWRPPCCHQHNKSFGEWLFSEARGHLQFPQPPLLFL